MEQFRSPVLLSRLAIAGLGIMAICHVLFVFSGIGQIISPARSFDLGDGDKMTVWLMAQVFISLVLLPGYIFTIVTFLMWLFRVFKNLPSLRSDQMEFTPGWAVGWWFIPFANLVKPFQAVRTAWAESDPEVELEHGFLTSVGSGAPGFISAWWALWIVSNIVSNITNRLEGAALAGEEVIVGYLTVVSSALWVIAAGFAIKVVLNITERQEQRSLVTDAMAVNVSPPPPPTFDTVND